MNEEEKNNPRFRALFKCSRHNNISIFTISQEENELPNLTIRGKGNIYHTIQPNTFRDDQNLDHGRTSIDTTLNEFKFLTTSCWDEKYQPLTTDMTKDIFIGRYCLKLNSYSFHIQILFKHSKWLIILNLLTKTWLNYII